MTEERITELRTWLRVGHSDSLERSLIGECLDEIEILQKQVSDANKAIKAAAKGK